MNFMLYLDLDGVMADFDARVVDILGHPSESRDEIRKVMKTPGFFRSLGIMPGANEAVTKLLSMLPGQVCILSAVPQSAPELTDIARADKTAWLEAHFPSLASSAKIVTDKGAVGTREDILVDDHILWNGADKFPGLKIEFTGPECWQKVISEVENRIQKKSNMVKASRLLNRDLDAL